MSTLGPLFILSGPSGSGKSTVIDRVLAESGLPLRLSVSATTRARRAGETDGIHYHFWTRDRFEEEIHAGSFLEWAKVHDNYYGTLKSEVEPYRLQQKGVVLDIDVKGADQIRRHCPGCISVFLRAPSLKTYEERMRKRATEDEAAIQRRLAIVQDELQRAPEYDHQIVNDDLDKAVAKVCAIFRRQFERTKHAG